MRERVEAGPPQEERAPPHTHTLGLGRPPWLNPPEYSTLGPVVPSNQAEGESSQGPLSPPCLWRPRKLDHFLLSPRTHMGHLPFPPHTLVFCL